MCQTMNVPIPDSARRPENSENYSCAREARPNFEIFWEEIYLHLYFVCRILCSNCTARPGWPHFGGGQTRECLFLTHATTFSPPPSITYHDVSGPDAFTALHSMHMQMHLVARVFEFLVLTLNMISVILSYVNSF